VIQSPILPPPDIYAAIADPTRRRLLELLTDGERPVKRLAEPFRMSRPAISQHLRVLRDAGLVRERRVGRERRYRLDAEPLRDVVDWVGHFERFWAHGLERLGDELGPAAAWPDR
jgi:DNA-binding transcriptional ArsR family regulator